MAPNIYLFARQLIQGQYLFINTSHLNSYFIVFEYIGLVTNKKFVHSLANGKLKNSFGVRTVT